MDAKIMHDKNIEECVLGCILISEIKYIDKLSDNDFSDELCKAVFSTIKQMHEANKEIDVIQVASNFKNNVFGVNMLSELTGMTDKVDTTSSMKGYYKSLKLLTARREVIKSSMEIIKKAQDGFYEDPTQLKNEAVGMLENINIYTEIKNECSMVAIMSNVLDDIDKLHNSTNEKNLSYGLADLDAITAGLHSEELTIIAARPGVGKTSIVLQIATHLAKNNNKVVLFSREMSSTSLGKRIISNYTGINGHKLRLCKSLLDTELENISLAAADASNLSLEIDDKTATIQGINSYCKELKEHNKLDVVIIDYLGLLQTTKKADSRRAEIESITRQLKEMAGNFDIPIVLLCQLNRETAQQDKEPALHNLRESGSIEQDADNVILLHIPKNTDETQNMIEIKLIIAKQRNGSCGYVNLLYEKANFKFRNLLR